jgi:NAD(P)-dependent dehydrogenase (short-subunit alcohol dehydrogenase family)
MTQEKRLEGKIAVITGGNGGIGLATAQRFIQEGAYAFISGRRQDELDKAVKQIGRNAMGLQGDVSNLADLDRLYQTVVEGGQPKTLGEMVKELGETSFVIYNWMYGRSVNGQKDSTFGRLH